MASQANDEDAAAVRAAEERFYQALRQLHAAGDDGLAALLATWADRDEVTTLNAAGGYEQGQAAVAGRWTWWARQGRPMPATLIEHLAIVVTPALAYTVALEHHGGRVLRVTHIYAPDGEQWKLLHRHADPLVERSQG
jgi:ketosteroid isomerase-like protein